ncbi:MAG: hypothetical protein QUS13_09980 [Smithella sp.]|nr:hypothetical protein [Smithella sp.]
MGNVIFWDIVNRKMGGIEKIILTLTQEFAKTTEVKVISHPDSTVMKILKESNAVFKWLLPEKEILEKNVAEDDLLIIFYSFNELKYLKKPNPRVLIWNVLPPMTETGLLRRWRDKITLQELMKKHSMVTMDAHCNDFFFKNYGIRLDVNYLHIPIDIKPNNYKYKIRNNEINITYIGRGNEIWKVKPVKKLVKDLSTLDKKFNIHIFTDMDDLFKKELAETAQSNINITYHFGYWGKKLSDKLISVADIHYSMGTAMLEGASLGIPTLIADSCEQDFPDNYKYRWFIQDVQSYGNFIFEKKDFKGATIRDIITLFSDKEAVEHLSHKQHEYISENYSPSYLVDKIAALKPKARVKTVLKYYPSTWF